jgi:TonB family protein
MPVLLRQLVFFVSVCVSHGIIAQVEYLDIQHKVLESSERAIYMRDVKPNSDGSFACVIKYITEETFMIGRYLDRELTIPDGEFQYFYANGVKESEGKFKNGYKVGTWKRWNFEGIPKPDRYYAEEDFVKTNRASSPAKFPGGNAAIQKHINQNLTYPEEAKNKKLEGTVVVTFSVDVTGKVKDAKVSTSVHYTLDEEALRCISGLPDWEPAMREGRPVESSYIMPVVFKLPSQGK